MPSLRRERPDISWGLESIARKCLAPDPAQRYQQADHLAEDLRRLLDDRPSEVRPRAEPHGAGAEIRQTASAADLLGHGRRDRGDGASGGRLGPRGRPRPTRRHAGTGDRSAPTTRECSGRSAWSTRVSICRTTCAMGSRPASGRSPSSERRTTGSGIGSRPGSGSPRRIAGGWRRTGASSCCSWPTPASAWPAGQANRRRQALLLLDQAESIPGLPPSRALLARPSALLFAAAETERAESARRAPWRCPPRPRAITICSPPRSPAREGRGAARPPSPSWTRRCGGTRAITGRWSSGESAASSEASSSRPRPTSASAPASGRNSPGVTSIAAVFSTGPATRLRPSSISPPHWIAIPRLSLHLSIAG